MRGPPGEPRPVCQPPAAGPLRPTGRRRGLESATSGQIRASRARRGPARGHRRAFVYTEKLKLTPSPILGTRVDKVFSPVCECETDTATISFRLRAPRPAHGRRDRQGGRQRTHARPGQPDAARTGHDLLGRPRRQRQRRSRGLLQAARPPRRGAAHDRAPQPDPGRRDAAARRARLARCRGSSPRTATGARTRSSPVTRVDERASVLLYVDGAAARPEARPAESRADRVVRLAGRRAAAAGRLPPQPRRAGRRGQSGYAHARAARGDPLRGARPRAHRGGRGCAVRGARAQRRGAGGLAPRRPERRGAARDVEAPRSAAARALHAHGQRQRVRAAAPPCSSGSPRREHARCRSAARSASAGPGAAARRHPSRPPDRRPRRLGCRARRARLYLLPDLQRTVLAGAAVAGLAFAAGRRLAAPALPVPARVPHPRVHPGPPAGRHRLGAARTCSCPSTPSSAALALALGWQLARRRQPRPRARAGRLAARRVRRSGRGSRSRGRST